MAEVPENIEVEPQEPIIKNKIDDSVAITRYIYIKCIEPYYTSTKRHKLTKMRASYYGDYHLKDHVRSLIESNPKGPVNLIKKAIETNSLIDNEQLMFCLAQVFRETTNKEDLTELRQQLPTLVRSQEDLLYFLSYLYLYKSCIDKTKLTLTSGMQRCLVKWYDSKSPSEYLEILFASDRNADLRHDDIIKMIHPKFENPDKNEITKAVFMDYEEIKKAARSSGTMKKILTYKDLKRCNNDMEVESILKRRNFTCKLDNLPTFAMSFYELSELMLPHLSLSEVVDRMIFFRSKRFLRVEHPLSRKICNALQCTNKVVKEAKLNPIKVFGIIQSLEIKKTYGCPGDELEDANPFIQKKLKSILNITMSEQPKTGCRYYVTMDFRKFSDRQSKPLGEKNLSCSEVQIILALSLLKCEKDVTLMSFTDDKNKLKPIKWTAKTTLEEAIESFAKEIKETPKTKENISLPLEKASEDKKKVDVFITFVSSVARTSGKHAKPPIETLKHYRETMDLKLTKYVVVNLTRKTPDFKYANEDIDFTGILELVGFSDNSMKVIQNFAKNCFV